MFGARIVPAAGAQRNCCHLPPHTIISLPVQTAVCPDRAAGAFVVLVLSRCPCRGRICRRCSTRPSAGAAPHNHFAAGPYRGVTVPTLGRIQAVLVTIQLSVVGLYLPPLLIDPPSSPHPPRTRVTVRRPRRSFHCPSRPRCDRVTGLWRGSGCRPGVFVTTATIGYFREGIVRVRNLPSRRRSCFSAVAQP